MYIKNLKLHNFRNYSDYFVDFDPNVNIIYGLNAEGKTNLIESISFLSNFKSFRTSKNKELIKFNENKFDIECLFNQKNRDYNMKVSFSDANKYEYSINSIKYRTKSEVLGRIKTIVFCPDDLFLIKDSPEARRKFINDTLIQFRPKYHKLLNDYNKYLKQKNYVLKNFDEKPSLLSLLPEYNEILAKLSAEITFIRANFINLLDEEAKIVYNDISGGFEKLDIFYNTKIENPSLSVNLNFSQYENLLKMYEKKEIAAKNCLIGIHKDDISFSINGNSAKEFASQGQIRSIILSVKFAIKELFFKDSGFLPILILDDVLSELDKFRQDYVLNRIKSGQIIITSPHINNDKLQGKMIYIKKGEI